MLLFWFIIIIVVCPLGLSLTFEPPHDKTNKMICAPSEDSDQPGHSPSLIKVFAVHSMGSWGPNVSSCGQGRLWSDWANAQADLSLPWAHKSFCWFCYAAAYFVCFVQNTLMAISQEGTVLLLSACVILDAILDACTPFQFCVLDRMWNLSVAVPDHCIFDYFSDQSLIHM